MLAKLRGAAGLLRAAWGEWQRDNAMMFAAAVAFYATFSLAPLLLLLLNTGAIVFGERAARVRVIELVGETVGPRAGHAVARLMEAASDTEGGVTALSAVLLVIAASAVFRHLKFALNTVLDVPTREDSGILQYIRRRVFAVVIVIVAIVLLLSALGTVAGLEWVRANTPEALMADAAIWRSIELAASFVMVAILFGMVLKFVPDVDLDWRHVAVAATVAAAIFAAAQWLLGLYLSKSNFASAYGAAGSVVLLLVYVYLTTSVLLAAAELTEVIARRDVVFRSRRREAQDEQDYQPRKEAE